MRVISWNVLSLDCEQKYNPDSKILSKYKGRKFERDRDIVDQIKKVFTEDIIIGLQECSVKLLELLISIFSEKCDIFYEDNEGECLVLIVSKVLGMKREYIDEKMYEDTSYGYVVCSNDRFRVVNCHLIPYFVHKKDNFEIIKNIMTDKITFVLGDFNTERRQVIKNVGKLYYVPNFHITYKKRSIDNIMFNFMPKSFSTQTFNMIEKMISDHNIIMLDYNY
jgi:hypothetical protein